MVSLTETARLHTSGARAVEPFDIDGTTFVAVPQLAIDIPGQAPEINGGDGHTSLLVFRADDGRFVEHQRLAVPGGEDAEFFRIDGRIFLATASIRTGSGPYEFGTESRIFEWRAGRFEPFQAIPTFAAKQWKAFTAAGRHFLALAQGVSAPGVEARNKPSTIYEWTGSSFEEFQQIPSEWGYNWHPFEVDGRTYLVAACIDGASPVMRTHLLHPGKRRPLGGRQTGRTATPAMGEHSGHPRTRGHHVPLLPPLHPRQRRGCRGVRSHGHRSQRDAAHS